MMTDTLQRIENAEKKLDELVDLCRSILLIQYNLYKYKMWEKEGWDEETIKKSLE